MTPNIKAYINTLPDKRVVRSLTEVFKRLFPNTDDTAITAFATGGQTSAKKLKPTCNYHEVTTVATAADSIRLPAAIPGEIHWVKNSAASNAMQVFGDGTDTIDSVATGTGVSQLAGTTTAYYCLIKGNFLRASGAADGITATYLEINKLAGATFTTNEANTNLTGIPYTATVASSAMSDDSGAMQFILCDRAGTAISYRFAGRAFYTTTASGSTFGAVSGSTAVTNGALAERSSGSFDYITTVSGRLGVNTVLTTSSTFITFEMPNGKLSTSTVITTT